ncbi:MAG: flagellar assembly protein FliW [Spirochaetales bacterium]
MRVQTKALGEVEIEERQVIDFPVGIFGFSNLHHYALLDAVQSGFYWLQSLEDSQIAFLMLNPYDLRPDYLLDVAEEDLQSIGYEEEEDLLVFAIVTVPEDQSKISANLQGPVLINRIQRLGRQAIHQDPQWKTKHLILEELARAEAE